MHAPQRRAYGSRVPVSRVAEGKLIIAEDLGVINEEVEKLREYSGYPGMRVLQFAFDEPDSPHLLHNYRNNCVAYTGTHDNNTLLGWVWELDGAVRDAVLEYFGYTGDWNGCYDTIIKRMFASSAGIVIFPVQDLLYFGADTRLNRPGRALGNWEFRMTDRQLASLDRGKYRRLNRVYSR